MHTVRLPFLCYLYYWLCSGSPGQCQKCRVAQQSPAGQPGSGRCCWAGLAVQRRCTWPTKWRDSCWDGPPPFSGKQKQVHSALRKASQALYGNIPVWMPKRSLKSGLDQVRQHTCCNYQKISDILHSKFQFCLPLVFVVSHLYIPPLSPTCEHRNASRLPSWQTVIVPCLVCSGKIWFFSPFLTWLILVSQAVKASDCRKNTLQLQEYSLI